MKNEYIALITLSVTLLGGGFLLSIPLMKKRHSEYLENENNFIEREKKMENKVSTLKSKVTKFKNKFKKKKKK